MEAYHRSIFSDESKKQITEIYNCVMELKPERSDAETQHDNDQIEELYSSESSMSTSSVSPLVS